MSREFVEALWSWVLDLPSMLWEEYRLAVYFAAFAVVRAAGRTIHTGQTGLKFSFGRAVRVVEPGFYPLLPFLQTIKTLPTRSRTLDLPQQRVTNLDGLVFDVDANLVFRVTDIRKALIEIDDLDRGMRQMLGLGVQEVLRARQRRKMYCSPELDDDLRRNLEERLAPWGVTVERAGFSSITPSSQSVRVTQQRPRICERARHLAELRLSGVPREQALVLLGTARLPTGRTRTLHRQVRIHRRRRKMWKLLDEALAEGRLHADVLPRRYRGVIEERAFPAREEDPRKGSLITRFRLPWAPEDEPGIAKKKSKSKQKESA